MKRLLLDVNVVLDVLLERSQHSEHAAALWALIETGKATGLLSADAVTIVHYLVAHEHDRRRARHAIDRLLSVFTVAAVDDPVIRSALRLGWADFEDAVTAAAAASAGCDALVTRNTRDFKGSPVPVIDAATALALVLSDE